MKEASAEGRWWFRFSKLILQPPAAAALTPGGQQRAALARKHSFPAALGIRWRAIYHELQPQAPFPAR